MRYMSPKRLVLIGGFRSSDEMKGAISSRGHFSQKPSSQARCGDRISPSRREIRPPGRAPQKRERRTGSDSASHSRGGFISHLSLFRLLPPPGQSLLALSPCSKSIHTSILPFSHSICTSVSRARPHRRTPCSSLPPWPSAGEGEGGCEPHRAGLGKS